MPESEDTVVEVEIRRRRQTLYYSGRAFVVFGIWSFIKIFFWLYLNPIDWAELVGVEISGFEDVYKLTFYVILAIIVFIDILFRLYIGLSAIGEEKGKKKRITYVIFAVLYIILTALSYTQASDDSNYLGGDTVTTVFLDVTSSIALVAIIINSWKLRKLGK